VHGTKKALHTPAGEAASKGGGALERRIGPERRIAVMYTQHWPATITPDMDTEKRGGLRGGTLTPLESQAEDAGRTRKRRGGNICIQGWTAADSYAFDLPGKGKIRKMKFLSFDGRLKGRRPGK